MKRVLVTGADGFVGRAVCVRLSMEGYAVAPVTRTSSGQDSIAIGDLAVYRDWPAILAGADVVVHLAARAHVTRESAGNPLEEFRRINVAPTLRLAEAAAAAGVSRFIFMSSIGVNGMYTTHQPFRESDLAQPTEPYAISKWEAEQRLLELAARTGLEVTRIRPPLILGPQVKGNLRRLMRLVDAGMPLPLGAVKNQRSFLALADLCELLSLCVSEPRAGNELLLAANAESISTPDLLRRIALELGRRLRLVPIPILGLRAAGRLLGMTAEIRRLTSSLLVDAGYARQTLCWHPPADAVARGVASMVRSYQSEKSFVKD